MPKNCCGQVAIFRVDQKFPISPSNSEGLIELEAVVSAVDEGLGRHLLLGLPFLGIQFWVDWLFCRRGEPQDLWGKMAEDFPEKMPSFLPNLGGCLRFGLFLEISERISLRKLCDRPTG